MRIGRGWGRGYHVVTAALAVLLAGGMALLVIGIRAQVSAPQAPLTSAVAAGREAQAPIAPAPGTNPATSPALGIHGPAAGEATSSAPPPAALKVLSASAPARISIPALDLDAPVNRVGLESDGTLEVPAGATYDQPAWFTGSPTPGARGPAVIEGHVDGAYGPSDFFQLGALRPGDTVTIARADGRAANFRVYRAERYAKDDFPTGAVYGNTPGAELRLITCGGSLNKTTGHHLDNTVIYAHLTS